MDFLRDLTERTYTESPNTQFISPMRGTQERSWDFADMGVRTASSPVAHSNSTGVSHPL
jgi:hypothetical protein